MLFKEQTLTFLFQKREVKLAQPKLLLLLPDSESSSVLTGLRCRLLLHVISFLFKQNCNQAMEEVEQLADTAAAGETVFHSPALKRLLQEADLDIPER